jgi:hypothetical protein
MTATSQENSLCPLFAVYCRSIAAPMAGYWRFWRAANVPPLRTLRSDYPCFLPPAIAYDGVDVRTSIDS